MQKVLLFAYSFPPINDAASLRVASFARHLPAFGWEPVVLAPSGGLGRGYGAAVPEGVEEWRVPDPDPIKAAARRMQGVRGPSGPGPPGASGWTRLLKAAYRTLLFPDRDILWAMRAVWQARRRLAGRPDIRAIISSASGASKHWAASWLHRQTGLPWIADFHDPWALDSPQERPRTPLRAWLERSVERAVCRQASQVTTVGAGYVPRLCCEPDRVAVIPAGFEPDAFTGLAPVPPPSPFRIAHTGTLYGGVRNPVPLFRAVRLLIDRGALPRTEVEIRFVGPAEPAVQAMAEREGVADRVWWSGYVPHRQSLELLAESHLLLLLSTGDGFEVPSKLYEYLAVGRPILALWRDGAEVSRLAQQAQAGFVCPPDEVERMAAFLAEQYRRWQEERWLPRPDPRVVAGLTRRSAAAKLAGLLDALTESAGGGALCLPGCAGDRS